MRINTLSRSRAFLIEFVIVILFFGIAAGIIVQVFAESHQMRQKANNLTIAAAKVQSIAEYAKASESKEEYAAQLEQLGAVRTEENKERYLFYYDHDWQMQKGKVNEGYQIKVDCTKEQLKSGELLGILIDARQIGKKEIESSLDLGEIYKVKVLKYYP